MTDKIYHCDENLSLIKFIIVIAIYHCIETVIKIHHCDKNLSLIKFIIEMKIYHW